HPEEDGPRLVYADWLEENGDCDGAEFIRIQLELAQPTCRDRRRPELVRRSRELLDMHRSAWFPEFTGWKLGRTFYIQRGFVDALETRGELFLHGLDDQF